MDVKKIPIVLQFKLTQLTPAQMKKEIKKVEDRIKKLQEEGKNEEEINLDFGSIDRLAAQILIDNGVEGVELPKEKIVDNLADINEVKLAEGQVPQRHTMLDGLFTAEELEEQKQKEKERAEREAKMKALREGTTPSQPAVEAPATPNSNVTSDNPYGLSNRLQEALAEQGQTDLSSSFGRRDDSAPVKTRRGKPVTDEEYIKPLKEKRERPVREKRERPVREKREKAPKEKKVKQPKAKKGKNKGMFGGGRMPVFEASARFNSFKDYDGDIVKPEPKKAYVSFDDEPPRKEKRVKQPRERRAPRERRGISLPSIRIPRPSFSLPRFSFSKEEGESMIMAILGWIFIGSWSAPIYMTLHALVKVVPFSLVYAYTYMLIVGIAPFESQGITIQAFAIGISFIGPTVLIMVSKPFYQFTYGIITLTNKGANTDIWFEEKENPFDFVKDYPTVYWSLITLGLIGVIVWLANFNGNFIDMFIKK